MVEKDQWTIRWYEPDDRDAVIRVTKEAWVDVTMAELRQRRFGVIDGKNWHEHKADSVMIQFDRRPETCFVAEVDGRVVGYATFGFRHGGVIGVVGNNAVDPRWQGRGIGTQLIQRVIEELEQHDVQFMEVQTFQHDAPARKVYERLGFTEIGRTIHYTRPAQRSH